LLTCEPVAQSLSAKVLKANQHPSAQWLELLYGSRLRLLSGIFPAIGAFILKPFGALIVALAILGLVESLEEEG
jgi:hypothetical protein